MAAAISTALMPVWRSSMCRHSGIYLVYLNWRDDSAWDTVRNTTEVMLARNYSCQKPCTDWAMAFACCDGKRQAQLSLLVPAVVKWSLLHCMAMEAASAPHGCICGGCCRATCSGAGFPGEITPSAPFPGLYLPSFTFRNAYGFSQDRPSSYKITVSGLLAGGCARSH